MNSIASLVRSLDRRGLRAGIVPSVILTNLLFLVCHPLVGGLVGEGASLVDSLLVNLVLFVIPASGWVSLLPRHVRGRGMQMIWCILLSSLILPAILAILYVCGVHPSAVAVWTAYWVVANLGLLAAWRLRPGRATWRVRAPARMLVVLGVFAIAYGFYYTGASRVVPPQDDHDFEVQATGYSLATRLEPLLATDRGTLYYFAHPPMLHMLVSGSFILYGDLEQLKTYDDISRRSLDQRSGRATPELLGETLLYDELGQSRYHVAGRDENIQRYRVIRASDGIEKLVPYEEVEAGRTYQQYSLNPMKMETRTPNIFFSAVTVALLFQCVWFIGRRWWLAALIAATYATSPEIFVRSSYGGYFAIGAFAVLALLMSIYRFRSKAAPLAIGAFVALADHKLIVLPAAIGLRQFIDWVVAGPGRTIRTWFHPAVVGFGIGMALFWAYGYLISPWDFFADHLRHHLLDRIAHVNPLGYGGYATRIGLWSEFLAHTSYLLVPVGMGSLFLGIYRHYRVAHDPCNGVREVALIFILLTSALFTVVDWRMTKHIILILIPIVMAMVNSRAMPKWQVGVVSVVAVLVILLNAWGLWNLAIDFDSFQMTPAW